MNQQELKNLVSFKEDRILILESNKQKLIEIEEEISVSKLSQSVHSIFYNLKRLLVAFFAIVFLSLGIVALISPSVLIFNDESLHKEGIVNFKDFFQKENKKSLQQSFLEIKNNKKFNTVELENQIEHAIQKTNSKIVHTSVRIIAMLFLGFALLFWYVMILDKKHKKREGTILKTNKIIQEIIQDYKHSIEEENREISDLKKDILS